MAQSGAMQAADLRGRTQKEPSCTAGSPFASLMSPPSVRPRCSRTRARGAAVEDFGGAKAGGVDRAILRSSRSIICSGGQYGRRAQDGLAQQTRQKACARMRITLHGRHSA